MQGRKARTSKKEIDIETFYNHYYLNEPMSAQVFFLKKKHLKFPKKLEII